MRSVIFYFCPALILCDLRCVAALLDSKQTKKNYFKMEKSPKIKLMLNRIIDFRNHKSLCRFCLNKFTRVEERQEIGKIIENQFFELTQIDVSN